MRRTPPGPPCSIRSALAAVVVLFTMTGAVLGTGTAPAAARPEDAAGRRYRPPVDGAVVDPFRPPEQDWLPGNRGIDYATIPGQSISAIGPGLVAFAGQVGGTLHVTVTHPDGLRSSYSFVAAVRVRVGDRVRGGDPVAVAGETFHLGVRRGDRYLDPSSLWGRVVGGGAVRLVPVDGAPPPSPAPTLPSPSHAPSPSSVPSRRPGAPTSAGPGPSGAGPPAQRFAALLGGALEALGRGWGLDATPG